jgi:prevent-host-death family protein
MDKTYSIAEARNDLSGVVREAEAGRPVTLSRRGKPVAVVVSAEDYARFSPRRPSLAEAVDRFRRDNAVALDDEEWLAPRDRASGRAAWQP